MSEGVSSVSQSTGMVTQNRFSIGDLMTLQCNGMKTCSSTLDASLVKRFWIQPISWNRQCFIHPVYSNSHFWLIQILHSKNTEFSVATYVYAKLIESRNAELI